jgi:hypothetical protein
MGYIGQAPANKVVKTADIEDSAITSAKILDGTIANADVNDMAATKLTGSIADARVPASAVTQHVTAFDDTSLRNDITTLALHTAISDNKASYNLPSSFIDQFEDDTGIGSETTTDRSTSGEFCATANAQTFDLEYPQSSGSDTKVLLHMEDTGLTDSSGNSHSTTLTDTISRSSTQYKFGSYSADITGDGKLDLADSANLNMGSGSYTIDGWIYPTSSSGTQGLYSSNADTVHGLTFNMGGSLVIGHWASSNGSGWDMLNGGDGGGNAISNVSCTLNAWNHFAVVRNGNLWYTFTNGVASSYNGLSVSGTITSPSEIKRIGKWGHASIGNFSGYIDEWRFSKGVARWTSAFIPPNAPYGSAGTVFNATGTMISNAQTPISAQTKVSGVMLYEDFRGTNTLGTDLKIYFSCDNGSNWTETASYGAVTPVFSSGVKMVRLGEATCTSGTQIKYKAVWANQAVGKILRLHGIGVNY